MYKQIKGLSPSFVISSLLSKPSDLRLLSLKMISRDLSDTPTSFNFSSGALMIKPSSKAASALLSL